MDYEAKYEENEEEEASEESDSGVASLALATAYVSKSIFNTEETDPTDMPDEDDDDYAPTYCFMAKGAKVLKYPPLNQVRMNLMKTSSLVIPNLLRLLWNN